MKNSIYRFLKWSEKYTETDMLYLTKSGFWLTSGQILNIGIGLILYIIFANLLPPDTYGIYQYIMSITSILIIPTLLKMNTSVIRSVAKGFDGTLIPAVKTRLLFGTIGSLAGLILSAYYYINDNVLLSVSFLIVSLLAPTSKILGAYGVLPNGKKRFKELTKYEVISTALETLILIGFLYFTNNILLILLAYYIPKLIVRYILFKISIKRNKTNNNSDPEAIPYGKHLSLMSAISDGVSQLDKVLMFHFLGPIQLAIYTFAISPISRIVSVLTPLNTMAFPKIANSNPEDIKKTLPKKIFKLFVLLIIPVGLYIILAPYIYQYIFPQYMDSVIYTQVFALIILFFPQKLIGTSLTAYAQKKALYFISTIGPIIKILLLIILIPIYGIWGAVVALMVPYLINTIMLTYYFRKI